MLFSKFATTALLVLSSTLSHVAQAQQGSDYIDAAPATVYEAAELSPQNMDFDMTNNMFVAHSGWYNDQLIHYYKFRIFAPGTYPEVIMPGGSSAEVPLQKIYFVTTDGTMDGVVGMPIIEYHTADGILYSDFMNAVLIAAPDGYVADTFKSVADIEASGATMTETDVVMNIPVVPTGSTLQDPMEGGTTAAPIAPTMVFYKGVEVQTFVFEVTDAAAATYFANTRDSATAESRQELTTGYEITVTNFATASFVSAIPLWHVNQFSTGVMEGMGGGPNPAGMRNVINLDRPDNGYSPLWNIFWGTEMPINYSADEFSNAEQATAENGFTFFQTPMYINCPDIGMVGEMNALKATSFETTIEVGCDVDSFALIGSAPAIILTADEAIMFVAKPSGDVVGETVTNGMGGYEYELMEADIPADTTEVVVMHNGESIRTIMVTMGDCSTTTDPDSGASNVSMMAVGGLFAAIMTVVFV